ncbi:fibronectin type III domain-containing protein [Hymenobacter saemangeumensis]
MKKTATLPVFFRVFLLMLAWLSLAEAHAQCAAPTNLAMTAISGTSAQLAFTASSSATSYTVSYTSPGSGTVVTVSPNPTVSPVPLAGLSPATTYTVTVVSNCAGGQTAAATVTFRTVALNDEPCTATVLPLSGANCQPTASTTLGATESPTAGYTNPGCSGEQLPRDVWFRFTTAATGPASTGATVRVAGAPANELRLFEAAACSGPFTEVACTSSPANTAAPALVVGVLRPNTSYFVRVSGYTFNTTPGAFTACVSDPPACGDPINLALGGITASTAQLAFAPGPGNTGYTVTLTPQGGGTTTQTFSAPPIMLTGLQPLTPYTLTLQATCAGGALGGVLTRTFTTGNPQDEPAGAVVLPLTATCQPVTGTTARATSTPANGYGAPTCGASNPAPQDVWFTFTTAATGLASQGATLTVDTHAGAPQPTAGLVRVFRAPNGAAGPFTEIGCSSAAAANALAPPLVVAGLSPNTTYYVAVSGTFNMAQTGPFTLCATPPPACPAPANLTAALQSTTAVQLSWSAPGTGGTYTVEYGPAGFAPGTGAAGSVVVPSLTALTYTATGLTAGQAYHFYVTRDCGAGGLSTRSGPGAFQPQAVANDDVCGAVPLTITATCQPTNATLAGATQTFGSPVTCYNGPADVWFTFTTPGTGAGSTDVLVTVTGATANSVQVTTAASCTDPRTAVACALNPFAQDQPAPPLTLRGLTPNTRYFVRVSTGARQPGPFTICLTAPVPVCNAVADMQLQNLRHTSVLVAFTPPAGSSGLLLTLTPQGGSPTTQTVTGSSVSLTGLQPSTTYTLAVATNCTAGGQSAPVVFTFTTPPPPPANNDCSGALPIQCGQTLIGSPANAAPTTLPNCVGPPHTGVFYTFTGTGDRIRVSLCDPGTTFNAAINVLQGSCAGLTCIGSNISDLSCTQTRRGTLFFNSQAGVQYYFFINSSAGPLSGNLALSVTCTPLATAASAAVEQIQVYPNPAQQNATVFIPKSLRQMGAVVTLFTVLGTEKATYALPASGQELHLNLVGLEPGLYIVQVPTLQGAVRKRLLIQ